MSDTRTIREWLELDGWTLLVDPTIPGVECWTHPDYPGIHFGECGAVVQQACKDRQVKETTHARD